MCKIIKLQLLPFREVLINIEKFYYKKERYVFLFLHINSFCNSINIYLESTTTMLDAWNTTITMAKFLLWSLIKKKRKQINEQAITVQFNKVYGRVLRQCYGLNVCLPTPNSYCEFRIPNVMVFKGGAFREWLKVLNEVVSVELS